MGHVLRMRHDGVSVLGFTRYSLIDQIDWDVGFAEKRGRGNPCGLYARDRRPRPVADAYRALLREFGQITIVPDANVFEVTSQPVLRKQNFK